MPKGEMFQYCIENMTTAKPEHVLETLLSAGFETVKNLEEPLIYQAVKNHSDQLYGTIMDLKVFPRTWKQHFSRLRSPVPAYEKLVEGKTPKTRFLVGYTVESGFPDSHPDFEIYLGQRIQHITKPLWDAGHPTV